MCQTQLTSKPASRIDGKTTNKHTQSNSEKKGEQRVTHVDAEVRVVLDDQVIQYRIRRVVVVAPYIRVGVGRVGGSARVLKKRRAAAVWDRGRVGRGRRRLQGITYYMTDQKTCSHPRKRQPQNTVF